MDIRRILGFLEAIRENNNREWFLENKKEYQAVRKIFEKDVEKLIERIMLYSKIAEQPRKKHDNTLQNNIFMDFPAAGSDIENCVVEHPRVVGQQDKRQEDY